MTQEMTKHLAILSVSISLTSLVLGCEPQTTTLRAAIGTTIDYFELALPCTFVGSDPKNTIQSVVKQETVELSSFNPAKAIVNCADDRSVVVEFVKVAKIELKHLEAEKFSKGENVTFTLNALDAAGKLLIVDNLAADALQWTLSGPVEFKSDGHPFPPFGNTCNKRMKISFIGAGPASVQVTWLGLTAKTDFILK